MDPCRTRAMSETCTPWPAATARRTAVSMAARSTARKWRSSSAITTSCFLSGGGIPGAYPGWLMEYVSGGQRTGSYGFAARRHEQRCFGEAITGVERLFAEAANAKTLGKTLHSTVTHRFRSAECKLPTTE